MKVLDSGHSYQLDVLDGDILECLTFVKRDYPKDKYPGNEGHYSGTTIQEVLRVAINRVFYLNNQVPCEENLVLIDRLREGIYLLEKRNAEKKGRPFLLSRWESIETMSTCSTCLHIMCKEH